MGNNNPLVSVIVPNYCHSMYLDERILSILNQTYNNFELIILDDCSPDNGASRSVIEKYRDNSHISQIIFNEKNSGSTFKQWEKGINLAKGEFIWIAESDDCCEPTLLEQLLTPIIGNSNVSISFCRSITFTDETRLGQVDPKKIEAGCINGIKFIHDFMKSGNAIVNASSAIFRKDVYKQINDDYKFYKGAGDRLFWIFLAERGDVYFVEKPLNYFRQHIKNTTKSCNQSGINQIEDKKILDYIYNKGYLTKKEYKKVVREYVKFHIFQMVTDKKLKSKLYKIWHFDFFNQMSLKIESWYGRFNHNSYL